MASKTVTWLPPYAPPSLSVSLQSGGGLDPDTQYTVAVYGCDLANFRQGQLSAEVSFTTTSTERSALLSWTDVGAEAYTVVFKKGAPGDPWPATNSMYRSPTNSIYYTETGTTFLMDGTRALYHILHPLGAKGSVPDPPTGLSLDGRGVAEMIGGDDADPITPEDIHAAASPSGHSILDSDRWALQGYIKLMGTTWFRLSSRHVWLLGMPTYSGSGNVIQLGTLNPLTGEPNDGPSLVVVPYSFARPRFSAANCKLLAYGASIIGCGEWSWGTALSLYPWLFEDGLDSRRSLWYSAGWTVSVLSPDTTMISSFIEKACQAIYSGDGNRVVDNSFGGLDLFGNNDTRIFRNHIHGPYAWSGGKPLYARISGDRGRTKYMRDVTTSENADPFPTNVVTANWYANRTSNPDEIIHEATLTLTAMHGADQVEGATVLVTRADGTIDAYGTTGSDGIVTLIVTRGKIYQDPSDPNAFSMNAWEDYGPHTITVVADGYQTLSWSQRFDSPPYEVVAALIENIPPELIDASVDVDVADMPAVAVAVPTRPVITVTARQGAVVSAEVHSAIVEVEVPQPVHVAVREVG